MASGVSGGLTKSASPLPCAIDSVLAVTAATSSPVTGHKSQSRVRIDDCAVIFRHPSGSSETNVYVEEGLVAVVIVEIGEVLRVQLQVIQRQNSDVRRERFALQRGQVV